MRLLIPFRQILYQLALSCDNMSREQKNSNLLTAT
jgi:hypothetical protein